MKKFFSSLFILMLAVVVFVVIAKDWIVKTAIEQGITRATGFTTQIDSLKFDFPSSIQIQGLHIENPKVFKEKTFVSIPEIYASVVFGEAIKGTRIHLPEVRLNIQEVNIEKNEKGISNIQLLSSLGSSKQAQKEAGAPTVSQKPPMPFLLERLELTIGKVSFTDRSGLLASSPLPKKMVMDLNVNHEVILNITDSRALVNVIVAKVLNGATLGRLLNIDPQALLTDSLNGVVGNGTQLIGGAAAQAQGLIESNEVTKKAEALLGTSSVKATEVFGGTASAAKEKVSGLLGKLKSPVGGDETEEAP